MYKFLVRVVLVLVTTESKVKHQSPPGFDNIDKCVLAIFLYMPTLIFFLTNNQGNFDNLISSVL